MSARVSTLAFAQLLLLIGLAVAVATVGAQSGSSAAPTLYWNTAPDRPLFVATPLRTMHFSWSVQWDSTNSTAWVVGTFSFSSAHGYVSVGTNSPTGMDGLCIICYANAFNGMTCEDWIGNYYDIDKARTNQVEVLSSRVVPGGVSQVVFRRVAFANGRDLGLFTWGTAKRVIWAYGPMDGDEAGTHPGEGIASTLVDFLSGEHPVRPKGTKHLAAVYAAVALTILLIVVIQLSLLLRVRVHHHVRTIVGVVVTLAYIGVFIWFIFANIADYNEMAALGPEARAMGDGAAAALAVLLLSGTRRFLPQDLLSVSHERMIVYHTVAGLAFVGCLVGHAIAMTGFYFLPYMFRWTTADRFPKLPGVLALLFAIFVVIPALLRFHVSYRAFRILHWLWIPLSIFTIIHIPRLLWCCLPGFILVVANMVWGRLANLGTRVEQVRADPATMCVILDVSRPYHWFFATGDAPAMGVAPAQWCYLAHFGLSLAWHPFSISRAEILSDGSGRQRQHFRFVIKETHGLAGGGGPLTTVINRALDKANAREKADSMRGRGSWTTKLWIAALEADPIKSLGATWMEGPFGRLQMPLRNYKALIFVSGGIGVTPNMLTLQYVAAKSAEAAANGVPLPWSRVLWLWACREPGMFALFADDLANYTASLKRSGVHITSRNFCTSKAPEAAEALGSMTPAVLLGQRPDYLTEFRAFADQEVPVAAMYSCGPLAMIGAANDAAAECAPNYRIHHHSEVFDV